MMKSPSSVYFLKITAWTDDLFEGASLLHMETNQKLYSWLKVTAAGGTSEWKPHLERKATLKGPTSIWWPHFFLYHLCLLCHRLMVVLLLDQEMYCVSSCMLWFWTDSVSENDDHIAVIFVNSGISFFSHILCFFVSPRWDYATRDKASNGRGHHRTAPQAVCNAVR